MKDFFANDDEIKSFREKTNKQTNKPKKARKLCDLYLRVTQENSL